MNDNLKEKLKSNIAISKMKEEEKKAMKNQKINWKKGIGIAACLAIGITGVSYAAVTLDKAERKNASFRGIGEGIDTAVENGYIAETNMDDIEQTASITTEEQIINDVQVQAKVKNFLMDDRNISLEFEFYFGENLEEYLEFEKLQKFDIKDFAIRDDKDKILAEAGGRNIFVSSRDKENRKATVMCNIFGEELPKTKRLNLSFQTISVSDEQREKTFEIKGDWNIDLEVPEIMYNRTDEYYQVISCDNSDFEVYASKVTDTGFEIGLTISNTRQSKEESDKAIQALYEEYEQARKEVYEQYGITENSSEDEMAMANSEVSKKVYKSNIKAMLDRPDIDLSGDYFVLKRELEGEDISDADLPSTKSYVENSNGERFYCTMSPGRRQNQNYIENDKLDFYETFGMIKSNVVLYYYGEPVTIELEKIK